ncbi:hypothetical protein TNCV_1538361 [Trichonephila clavipes]|nr:hypothetical protein TNCV_1538361 [Trichonephila clavipes]
MCHSSTSEIQGQVIVTGIVPSCGCEGHSTADIDGQRIAGCVQINSVCWRYQLKQQRSCRAILQSPVFKTRRISGGLRRRNPRE